MSTPLHESLRLNAWALLERRGRPSQINLRRAVSAAYYALFHFLIYQVVQSMLSRANPDLQARVSRALQHGEMKEVCNWFRHAAPPQKLQPLLGSVVPDDLRTIAETFIELQQQRHSADYDIHLSLSHPAVVELVDSVNEVFDCWERLRCTAAEVFLATLVFGKRWDR